MGTKVKTTTVINDLGEAGYTNILFLLQVSPANCNILPGLPVAIITVALMAIFYCHSVLSPHWSPSIKMFHPFSCSLFSTVWVLILFLRLQSNASLFCLFPCSCCPRYGHWLLRWAPVCSSYIPSFSKHFITF